MTSPPNFLSFAALQNTSRTHSPIPTPFLSPFPSSPSSPGVEPRRTKSRHMDTFSFFDAKNHGHAGPLRESTPPGGGSHYPQEHAMNHSGYSQQAPVMNRWEAYQPNPSSQYSPNRAMTPGGTRTMMQKQWIAQNDPFLNNDIALTSPSSGLMSPGIGTVIGDDGDEVISTAVVVKNIPFSLKKETLLDLFDQMTLPKPYAFNYHFDNGTFRGLAFANFHSPEETQHVIRALNGYELIGRKLRVEYKKVLPADQRERIELQKRQKAVQEDPLLSTSPRAKVEKKLEIDLNDPATLQIYSSLLLFRDDNSSSAKTQMAFPPEFSPHQRRVVHLISQKLGLEHSSRGDGEERYVVISRLETGSESSGGSQLVAQQSNLMMPSTNSPAPLRIDTKQADVGQRKTFAHANGPLHAPHLQPPGLKQMKSYSDLRAPSPLRTSAGALGSDCFASPSVPSSNSPFASPIPSYPHPLASPGVGGVINGISDMGLNGSIPTRQPKGPEPKNSFVARGQVKKDED